MERLIQENCFLGVRNRFLLDVEISDILEMQKVQANNQFCKFITKNYKSWLHNNNSPLLSNKVFQTKVFLKLKKIKHYTLY